MNKGDFERFQFLLLQKLGVSGGWIDKIDGDGVYLYLTWGATKKIHDDINESKTEDEV